MKYFFCLVILVSTATFIRSQSVSINNDGSSAHESAMLDIKSNNKGILIPRMNTVARIGIGSPATGLMVYDTTLNGYYCFNGASWINVSTELNTWNVNGNTGTNPASNFIGTTDNKALQFKILNLNAGKLDSLTRNTSFGFRSLDSALTTGLQNNTVMGYKAMMNSRGTENTIIGSDAFMNNKIGSYNTVVGFSSMINSDTAYYNTVIGQFAGSDNKGWWNTIIGEQAGRNNLAWGNVFIGSKTGISNTSGGGNTFVGDNSGYFNNTGSGNTYFGAFSGFYGAGDTVNNNTLIGQLTGVYNKGAHNTYIGSETGYGGFTSSTGSWNTAVGSYALNSITSGSGNTAIGHRALNFNSAGIDNVATGFYSLQYNNNGTENTSTGNYALRFNTGGSYNTATGAKSLVNNTNGLSNTATGSYSLFFNTTGSVNTATGHRAMVNNTTGNENVATGYQALNNNTTASFNTAVGTQSLLTDSTGFANTAIGYQALKISNGNGNVAMGYLAGDGHQGHNSTLIGNQADAGAAGLDNATAIGFASRIDNSNAMSFGSEFTTRWCFGRASNSLGALQVGTNATNGNGAHLTVGGVWTNASDENLKENFTELDSREILENISLLKLTKWSYKGTPKKEIHIGPMAQQFKQLFNVGTDGEDKSISTIDPSGIALVAIQELRKQNLSLQKLVEEQSKKIDRQQQQLDLLLKFVQSLTKESGIKN